MKCKDILNVACEFAPLSLSEAMVNAGSYDNSGLIVENECEINKILVCLDLTTACVNYAINGGYKLILTHHPAIYAPVKCLQFNKNKALTLAALNGIAVISMHLNLDITRKGIDACFADGLGGKQQKVLTFFQGEYGYGRAFQIEPINLVDYAEKIKKVFSTDNVMVFGNRRKNVKKVVSFCGGGCDIPEVLLAEKEKADVIVSSDMKHHVITEALERGICVIQTTHYASESYGMKVFASYMKAKLKNIEVVYFNSTGY